jgi:hypothetical protein
MRTLCPKVTQLGKERHPQTQEYRPPEFFMLPQNGGGYAMLDWNTEYMSVRVHITTNDKMGTLSLKSFCGLTWKSKCYLF